MNSHTHSFYWSGSHSHTANFYYGNAYEDSSNNLDNWYIPRTWTTQNYVEHTYQRKNNVTSTTITINGTTGEATGNTASTTSTGSFTGIVGTTETSGSGTAFSIMPPYIIKYCFERIA